MKNIYYRFLEEQSKGTPLVLATVTATIGSTPQKPGSSAVIDSGGLVAGTVGGGIVEGNVIELSRKAILSKRSIQCQFDLANGISDESEAICGGKITVLIDCNTKNYTNVFKQIKDSLDSKIPGVLITMVTADKNDEVLINRYWMTANEKPSLPVDFLNKLEPMVIDILKTGKRADYRSLELAIEGEEPSSLFYLEPIFPPENLVIAGAGHIGKALAKLGSMLNFEVTVIDNRREYANFHNLSDADHIITNDIGKAFAGLKNDRNTYIVIVTRGHKDDANALKEVINSDVAYIGMIGSKKKIAAMKADFIERGLTTEKRWAMIHAPIGLDIKSQTVEEIAVSIAAQLVLIRNSK